MRETSRMHGRVSTSILLLYLMQTVIGGVKSIQQRKITVTEIVERVAESAQAQLGSRMEMLEQCGCSHHACSSSEDQGLQCSAELGSTSMCSSCGNGFRVNRNQSYVRTPPGVDPKSLPLGVQESLCLHQGLDEVFQEFANEESVKTWTYFGSSSGVMRIWPGKPRMRGMSQGSYDEHLDNCRTYEPRLRPWYIAAVTTGPKDVVILLDTSESMGAPSGATTRLDLMKNLVELLLVYTSFADFVSIVPFGKVVEPLISDQLVAASKPTKAHLLNSIRFLEAGGNSKLSDGFKTAFSILKNSAAVGHTSECQKIIILISDGHFCNKPTYGICDEVPFNHQGIDGIVEEGQAALEDARQLRASIFTFSIGRKSQNGVMRRISCAHSGTWAELTDTDDPLNALRGYLSTIASRWNGNDIVWSNFYEDDGGLGRMTTATRPIFSLNSSSPMKGHLMGVVGHDVLVSRLSASGLTYEGVLGKVISRISGCTVEELGICPMQVLRGEEGQCPDVRSSTRCYKLLSTGHLYYPSTKELSRADAARRCHSLGGYLATLTSDEEVLLGSGMSMAKGSWIGLELNEGKWKWERNGTEDSAQANLWSPGYQSRERCAAIDRRGVKQNAIRKNCLNRLHYICEFDSDAVASKVCSIKKLIHVGDDYRELIPSVLQCLTSFGEMKNATEHVSQVKVAREKLNRLKNEPVCSLGKIRRTEELLCCGDCGPQVLDVDILSESSGRSTMKVPLITLGVILPCCLLSFFF